MSADNNLAPGQEAIGDGGFIAGQLDIFDQLSEVEEAERFAREREAAWDECAEMAGDNTHSFSMTDELKQQNPYRRGRQGGYTGSPSVETFDL